MIFTLHAPKSFDDDASSSLGDLESGMLGKCSPHERHSNVPLLNSNTKRAFKHFTCIVRHHEESHRL